MRSDVGSHDSDPFLMIFGLWVESCRQLRRISTRIGICVMARIGGKRKAPVDEEPEPASDAEMELEENVECT